MTFFFWFLFAFSILSVGYGYVGWRLIVPAQLHAPWNAAAWLLLIVFLILPAIAMYLAVNRIDAPWRNLVEWIAYLSLGFFSVVLTLLIVRDVAWVLVAGAQKLAALIGALWSTPAQAADLPDPQRREVLLQSMNVGILAVAAAVAGYGFYEARRRPAIIEVSVPIENLPTSLDGFRIVQITDIHAGLTVARPFVETVVEMANELKGDIIAFTGDLVDGSVEHLREEVAPMSNLTARYGRYFITGNHEYYSGAEPWVEEAKRMGFDVLLNEHRVIRHGDAAILLAGVTDTSAGQFVPSHASDPHKAIANAPATDVKILLAHQPRSLYEAVKAGYNLQISGHTHGGQFFPWNFLAAAGQPYIKGLHKHENMWIYVSKGTGYWGPPVRLGARSEITVITLTSPTKNGSV
jgi:hypothetical protein